MKTFENAVDFRKSLEMRLLKQAQSTGIDLQRMRKQVAFERFLARLFRQEHSHWILKGGHAMELRLKLDFLWNLELQRVHLKNFILLLPPSFPIDL